MTSKNLPKNLTEWENFLKNCIHDLKSDPVEISSLQSHTHLTESGILDSFDYLSLISQIEKKIGMDLDLSEADPMDFLTVAGLAKILMQQNSKNIHGI